MKPGNRPQWPLACGVIATSLALVICAAPVSASSAHVATSEFDGPSGLAVADGHLWVTNLSNSSLTEIDPSSGTWLATFRSTGYGFDRPSAIVSTGNDLFIANASGSVTEVRADTGALVRRITGARYRFSSPAAITVVGNDVLVLNSGVSGSITELSANTGDLHRVIRGPTYAFASPSAFAATGVDLFVADEANDSVTEVDVTTGKLLRVISRQGLRSPDGVAIGSGYVWVADHASSAVTRIAVATGVAVNTYSDKNASYGFWRPTAMISTGDNIYVMTPLGTSPMVTKVSATTAKPYWFMCNTNGPYYFSLLSAFAISNGDLWVASRSGANSKTAAAATGSLTELSLGSGSLIRTLPSP